MEQRTDSRSTARGLTVKQLTFIFIAGVGVCAVFFTLGFLVGSNERNVNANTPEVERVSPPGDIPPPVNAPPDTTQSSEPNATTPSNADSGGQVQEQNIPSTGPSVTASTPGTPSSTTVPVSSPTPAVVRKQSSAAKSAAPPAHRQQGSGLIVQIAALHSAEDAESMVATLRSQGYPAFLVTPEKSGLNDGVYPVSYTHLTLPTILRV